ncbi:hypothetical protein N8586_02800 [Verrucomicrobiales bacterium]|nr:hypothetical protein [Verrucomicrobiales bacterium]MDA7614042.1 hypothetical protein [Verrucomicrobiales bacterium]
MADCCAALLDKAGWCITQHKLDAIRKPYIMGHYRCPYISRMVSVGNIQLKQGVLQANAVLYKPFASKLAKGNLETMKAFVSFALPE